MQKDAKKRNLFNKLREMSNVSGIAAEKFFDPEFKQVMESLRKTDDSIRALVSGEDIGDANPGADPTSLKDLLKSAKSNFNRREYMTAIAALGRFHKKVYDVTNVINGLNLDVNKIHEDFLFKELDDDQKKYLHDLKSRFASYKPLLSKEAGIMDFFMNIGTKRGRALAAWEKRYPKQVGTLKKDTSSLIHKSETLYSNILSALKEMATSRATRNVDNYVKATDKISKSYQSYDKIFRQYYLDNVKGFLEKQELIAPTKEVDNSVGKQEVSLDIPNLDVTTKSPTDNPSNTTTNIPALEILKSPPTDTITAPPANTTTPLPEPAAPTPTTTNLTVAPSAAPTTAPASPASSTTVPLPNPIVVNTLPKSPAPTGPTPSMPSLGPLPAKPPAKRKSSQGHREFLNSLSIMHNENPVLLALHIQKYAKQIEKNDPETAINLLNIVQSIKI